MLPPLKWAAEAGDNAPGDTPAFEQLFTDLSDSGLDFYLLNPSRWPWNPFAGKHSLLCGIDVVRALYVLVAGRRFDAVFTITESPALLLLLLRRIFLFRVPVVLTDVAFAAGWQLRQRILNIVLPRADAIAVLTANHIDHIRQQWPCKAPISVVPLHVDTRFFQPGPFVSGGPMLTVGDDVGRDYDTLVRAMGDLKIWLVAKTKAIPRSAETDRRIAVIRGRLRWRELRQLYAEARFVVVPLAASVHASGISSLLEAMAMGKAVIVSDSPGIRGAVEPDVTALVVPCGDDAALRRAIERLWNDDLLRQRLGAAARAFVEKNNSYAVTANRLAKLFYELHHARCPPQTAEALRM